MEKPSRRGLFALLAGAAVAPILIKEAGYSVIDADWAIDDFVTDNLMVKASERISYGYTDVRAVRDLLLPGLREIESKYEMVPVAWKSAPEDEAL